jgi:hypothetical protein
MKRKVFFDQEISWVKVVKIIKRPGAPSGLLYNVITKPKFPICVTGKHMIPTREGFKAIEGLKPGDEVCATINTMIRH